jgi:hypothetical protein
MQPDECCRHGQEHQLSWKFSTLGMKGQKRQGQQRQGRHAGHEQAKSSQRHARKSPQQAEIVSPDAPPDIEERKVSDRRQIDAHLRPDRDRRLKK